MGEDKSVEQGEFKLQVETSQKEEAAPAVVSSPKKSATHKKEGIQTVLIPDPVKEDNVVPPKKFAGVPIRRRMQPSPERSKTPPPFEVIRNKNKIISVLKHAKNLSPDLRDDYIADKLTLPMLGELSKPRYNDNLYFQEGGVIPNADINIANFLHSAREVTIEHSRVRGMYIGSASKHIKVIDSYIEGYGVFAGGEIEGEEKQGNRFESKSDMTFDCENVFFENSIINGDLALRNVKGGVIRNCIVFGEDVLKHAWGGLLLENVIIVDATGEHKIGKKRYDSMSRPAPDPIKRPPKQDIVRPVTEPRRGY